MKLFLLRSIVFMCLSLTSNAAAYGELIDELESSGEEKELSVASCPQNCLECGGRTIGLMRAFDFVRFPALTFCCLVGGFSACIAATKFFWIGECLEGGIACCISCGLCSPTCMCSTGNCCTHAAEWLEINDVVEYSELAYNCYPHDPCSLWYYWCKIIKACRRNIDKDSSSEADE